MAPIATYVFIDLETTGFPREEGNQTKITELSLVAVKRDHLLDTRPGLTPRVQHKLTLCFNPGRLIQPTCTEVTGLCNDLLEYEPRFDIRVFNMIDTYIKVLQKPVCLIAQNGLRFDYPILKNHFVKLKVSVDEDLMCADCYHAFYDIMEARKKVQILELNVTEITKNDNGEPIVSRDETDLPKAESMKDKNETTPKQPIKTHSNLTPMKDSKLENLKTSIEKGFEQLKDSKLEPNDETDLSITTNALSMKAQNETTPKTFKTSRMEQRDRISKVRRRFPWSQGSKPTEKYKLKDIYERLLNRPAMDAHRAENDCILALECAVCLGKDFVDWVDDNYVPFTDIKPMTIGVRLGD